jgi:hypothetical protein
MSSTGGNEPISPEVCVATFLRFLYGDRVMALHLERDGGFNL